MTKPIEPYVSDHAVIRYFERVYGLDIAALRAEILTPEVKAAILAGASCVMVRGHRAPVENFAIKTILSKGMLTVEKTIATRPRKWS